MRRKLIIGILLLPVVACCGTVALAERSADDRRIIVEARDLTREQAAQLEQRLQDHPDDLQVRLKLLGYHWAHRLRDRASAERHAQLVHDLIQRDPESSVLGTPHGTLDPMVAPEAYVRGKQLWQEQVNAHPDNAQVYGNAARYLLLHDDQAAEALLKRATEIESDAPDWWTELAHLYALRLASAQGEARQTTARQAVEAIEKALSRTRRAERRFYLIGDLAEMKLAAGDDAGAAEAAHELLALAKGNTKDWNHGNAIYTGHDVLGRVAVRAGDIESAVKHLEAAGATPGSPQLNSFGPNFELAAVLLAEGRREAVLDHLSDVRRFWEMGQRVLDRWEAQIRAGQTPNFSQRFVP